MAALLYSVLQTAKLVGVEPKTYLLHAARTAIRTPGTSIFPHEIVTTTPTRVGPDRPEPAAPSTK